MTLPASNTAADVEELSSRPVKRRRRENSLESMGSSLVTQRSSRLSPIPPQPQREHLSQLGEYRDVERQVEPPRPARRSSQRQQYLRSISLDDDIREIVPPQNMSKHRESTGARQALNVEDLPSVFDERPRQPSYDWNAERERSSMQRGGRWNAPYARESPDELQGEATVIPAQKVLGTGRKPEATARRSPKTVQVEILKHEPAASTNGYRERIKSKGKDSGPAKRVGHHRLFNANFFRFGTVERWASDGRPLGISLNDQSIRLVDGMGSQREEGGVNIALLKIRDAFRGTDDSHKVRLNLSSSEGAARHVDIELWSTEDKDDFCARLMSMLDMKLSNKPRYVFSFPKGMIND